jgi:uncharacterized protein with PQ loop repeat
MMATAHHRAAVTLALVLVGPVVATDTGAEWWYPGAGVAKLYSWNDDFVTEHVHHDDLVTGRFPVVFAHLAFLSEDSVETRVRSDSVGKHRAVTLGAGSGAGSGKSGSQATSAVAAGGAAGPALKSVRGAAGAVKDKQPLATRSWFGWMRFSLSFAFVVKTLCMMCNICYQASPLPMISEFRVKGDTGVADLAPFIAVAFGGWQWCYYGMFAYIVTSKSGFLVLVYSNVVGATLGLYYVYAFTLNCNNAAMLQRSNKYYYVLACIVAVQFIAIVSLRPVQALFLSGLISSAWSTIASLSLISTVPLVIEKRSSASLPVPLLAMGEIASILWVICGVMLWDPWITVPNCFALVVCTSALYLCWIFPADGPECQSILDDAKKVQKVMEVDSDEDTCDFKRQATPLQRALGLVGGNEKEYESLQDSRAASRSMTYGGTGGTGDGF